MSADLVTALRAAGLAEVDSSVRRRAEYSGDASNYRVLPRVVAFPRHVDEVIAALSVVRDLAVPFTSRGAGTSIAGNAVGAGLVLDYSRHLNRVVSIDPAARTAVVEPGTVLDSISAAAAPYGLRFGPDPSTHSRATIGGSLGNNACGSRALKYGRTADNVVSLDFLSGAGERLAARRFERDTLAAAGPAGAALDALVAANLKTIRTEFGRFTRQVSGYSLEHLLPERGADLAKFLVGSEGTLGVILGATVALVDNPKSVALAVLGYPDMPAAAEAVLALLPHHPVALESMDARLVDVVRSRRGPSAVPPLPRGGGWLLVETTGDTEAEALAAAERLVADAGAIDSLVVSGAPARALWRIREDGAGLGGRTPDGNPAWPGWEDAAVPPARLPAYLREFEALMKRHDVDGLLYGHFGDGCVHCRIDFPLAEAPQRFRAFLLDAADLAGRHGGSVSGEHGDGRARSELLPKMYSSHAIELFGRVKAIFDPANLLNPGVLVDPAPVDADLRVSSARPLHASRPGFAFAHDGGDLSLAVHRCTGVGKCRVDNTDTGGVMCPSYLATGDEKDSTRARSRVLQEVAQGTIGFDSAELAQSLDLCLACKGCASDCPTGIDMATYKSEALYRRYRRRRRPASHYALGWLPRWARLASHTPSGANTLIARPVLARLAKRLAGVDQRRPLPAFAPQTFRQWFAAPPVVSRLAIGPSRPPSAQVAEKLSVSTSLRPPVLLWADTFTNHFSPEVGQAAVRVLEAAGYSVQLTRKPVCCGLTWISTGQLDGARKQLRRSLKALDSALVAGTPIVGLEPSCTAALRSDAAELLPDDPRAAKLSSQVVTLAELLSATDGWAAPDLTGVEAVAQPHCHQHAVLGWDADAALLAAAGAYVNAVGGCCGLAGNFGVEKGHYDVSVAVAETALLPAVRAASDSSVVLADGFSCRTQLLQLAPKPGIHLAQLLASHIDEPSRPDRLARHLDR